MIRIRATVPADLESGAAVSGSTAAAGDAVRVDVRLGLALALGVGLRLVSAAI
jgi:hypothetical protein